MIQNIVPLFLQTDSFSLNAIRERKLFEPLDSCFTKTVELVEMVCTRVHGLNWELEILNRYLEQPHIESTFVKNEGDLMLDRPGNPREAADNTSHHSSIAGDIVDAVSMIAKFSKSTKDVLDHFEHLPAALEGGKEVLGIVSSFGKGVSELSTVMGSAKSALSTDVISGVLTSVTGFAEASLPLTAATGMGALASLAALTLKAQLADQNGGPVPFENIAPGKMRQFYMERERQKDYERLIELRSVSNYKQLSAVESELDSEYMLADRARRVNKDLEKLEIGAPLLSNKWVVGAPAKRPQSGQDPIITPVVPDSVKLADEIKRIRDLAAFESMGGKVNEKKLASDIANARKKFGKRVEPAWRLPSEQEWELHRRDELGLPHPDMAIRKRAGRGEPNEHHGSRVININRPLIEHLTINTTSTADGINKLKDQIEETLIGILNDSLM